MYLGFRLERARFVDSIYIFLYNECAKRHGFLWV